jgi:integrase
VDSGLVVTAPLPLHPGHQIVVGLRFNIEDGAPDHGMHSWWYRRLANAGTVPTGTSSGERMHKARHTAAQRVLDATGNLKAVQKLLGHSSIQTVVKMSL